MSADMNKDENSKSIRLDELFGELQRDAQTIEPGLTVFETRKVNSDSNSAQASSSEVSHIKDSPQRLNISCPYLGLQSDLRTQTIFPSKRNYCHRSGHAVSVDVGYQSQFCLASEYKQCSYFLAGITDSPSESRGYQEKKTSSSGSGKRVIWGGLLLFVVLLVVALVFLNGYIF